VTRCFFLCVVLCGCRYVGPVTPQVSAERPELLSTGDPTDPTRQPQLPARRCLVECGAGFRCNQRTAECEADPAFVARDGGVPWLP
jgi:hypothetical protein